VSASAKDEYQSKPGGARPPLHVYETKAVGVRPTVQLKEPGSHNKIKSLCSTKGERA